MPRIRALDIGYDVGSRHRLGVVWLSCAATSNVVPAAAMKIEADLIDRLHAGLATRANQERIFADTWVEAIEADLGKLGPTYAFKHQPASRR